MASLRRHEIYSCDASVYLFTGKDKMEAFRCAVEEAGFIPNLLMRWQASHKGKQAFQIAIKPNIMTASRFEADSPVYTDPAMVEALIHLMQAEGFTRFVVVESQNVYSYSYTGRDVASVAQMCGYTGNGYKIVDLTNDIVEFDYGGALGKRWAGRAWVEADYRISFAKNKSHWQCFYTACLKNVYGCLPEWDKMRHYHGKDIEFYQSAIAIADAMPVHFGFLDAWISGDGLAGHVRDPDPNPTRTIFSSDNIYAIDWVAGEKMRIDPLQNCVVKEAYDRWGPITINRVGDMTPWPVWENVRPIVIKTLDIVEESYWVSRFMSRAMASDMDPRFPPVSRWQWFFNIPQTIVRFIEGLLTKTAQPRK